MATIQLVDYIIFSVTIILSFVIGIYSACKRKDVSTDEYFMAKRSMGCLPVSVSLLVSFFSAVAILGHSSEMYYYGAEYWFGQIGMAIGMALVPFTFIPLYHSLNLVSVHKYLKMRFQMQGLVYMGTFLQCWMFCLINGVVLYAPATMVESMSGIPVWTNMLVMGLVATIYTTMGGFKAVIWADVFQAIIIVIGLIVVNILGVIEVGGMAEVWKIYGDQGRLSLNWMPSPFVRSTVFGFVIGYIFFGLQTMGVTQVSVQRFCSLPTMRDVKRSAFCGVPLNVMAGSLTCFSGVVSLAYFSKQGCDPLRAGKIKNPNQVVAYFINEVLLYPGVQGLFIACIICGTLSNLSSMISSTAAVIWDDLMNDQLKKKGLSANNRALVTKALCVVAGIVSTGTAFVMAQISGTLIQIVVSVANITIAPVTIMVVLGAVSKRSSWKTALAGSLSGFIFLLWILIGNHLSGLPKKILPTVTTNCSSTLRYAQNSTSYNTTFVEVHRTANISAQLRSTYMNTTDGKRPDIFLLYRISYIWYPPMGITFGVIIGLMLTAIPGLANKEDFESQLLFPFIQYIFNRNKRLTVPGTDDDIIMAPLNTTKQNSDI